MANADLWFDPLCPWSWLASRWLLEAERVRDVRVGFHVMSLALLNERDTDASADRRSEWWGPGRVAIATELSLGPDALRELYTALGALIHREQAPIERDLYGHALARSGLPHTLANAAESPYYDDALIASHHAGMDPVGEALGTPVIHITDGDSPPVALFGPVVTPYPRGEAAGRLWDGVALAATTDGFFELKRQRTRDPVFD